MTGAILRGILAALVIAACVIGCDGHQAPYPQSGGADTHSAPMQGNQN